MGAHGHQGLIGVVMRNLESPICFLFEVKEPVGQYAHRFQGIAHLIRYSAEVLADHEAPVSLAFQGQDSQKVLKGVTNIGPFRRLAFLRHPEEPHESHHMVNP